MPYPFEVSFEEIRTDLDTYVDAVFAALTSEFLVMPKGPGFDQRARRERRRKCDRGRPEPRGHQLPQDETRRAAAGLRSSPGLRHPQRDQSQDRHRGQTHRGRWHGPRQGHARPASGRAQPARTAAGPAEVRGRRLHRRPWFRRPQGGHEEAPARDAGEGVHDPEHVATRCVYRIERVPHPLTAAPIDPAHPERGRVPHQSRMPGAPRRWKRAFANSARVCPLVRTAKRGPTSACSASPPKPRQRGLTAMRSGSRHSDRPRFRYAEYGLG